MSIFSALTGVVYIFGGFALGIYAFLHPEKDRPFDHENLGGLARGFALLALVFSAIIIAFTEKLISGNNVDFSEATLENTSQLIPFLIGVFSFVSTIWTCIKDTAGRAKKD